MRMCLLEEFFTHVLFMPTEAVNYSTMDLSIRSGLNQVVLFIALYFLI